MLSRDENSFSPTIDRSGDDASTNRDGNGKFTDESFDDDMHVAKRRHIQDLMQSLRNPSAIKDIQTSLCDHSVSIDLVHSLIPHLFNNSSTDSSCQQLANAISHCISSMNLETKMMALLELTLQLRGGIVCTKSAIYDLFVALVTSIYQSNVTSIQVPSVNRKDKSDFAMPNAVMDKLGFLCKMISIIFDSNTFHPSNTTMAIAAVVELPTCLYNHRPIIDRLLVLVTVIPTDDIPYSVYQLLLLSRGLSKELSHLIYDSIMDLLDCKCANGQSMDALSLARMALTHNPKLFSRFNHYLSLRLKQKSMSSPHLILLALLVNQQKLVMDFVRKQTLLRQSSARWIHVISVLNQTTRDDLEASSIISTDIDTLIGLNLAEITSSLDEESITALINLSMALLSQCKQKNPTFKQPIYSTASLLLKSLFEREVESIQSFLIRSITDQWLSQSIDTDHVFIPILVLLTSINASVVAKTMMMPKNSCSIPIKRLLFHCQLQLSDGRNMMDDEELLHSQKGPKDLIDHLFQLSSTIDQVLMIQQHPQILFCLSDSSSWMVKLASSCSSFSIAHPWPFYQLYYFGAQIHVLFDSIIHPALQLVDTCSWDHMINDLAQSDDISQFPHQLAIGLHHKRLTNISALDLLVEHVSSCQSLPISICHMNMVNLIDLAILHISLHSDWPDAHKMQVLSKVLVTRLDILSQQAKSSTFIPSSVIISMLSNSPLPIMDLVVKLFLHVLSIRHLSLLSSISNCTLTLASQSSNDTAACAQISKSVIGHMHLLVCKQKTVNVISSLSELDQLLSTLASSMCIVSESLMSSHGKDLILIMDIAHHLIQEAEERHGLIIHADMLQTCINLAKSERIFGHFTAENLNSLCRHTFFVLAHVGYDRALPLCYALFKDVEVLIGRWDNDESLPNQQNQVQCRLINQSRVGLVLEFIFAELDVHIRDLQLIVDHLHLDPITSLPCINSQLLEMARSLALCCALEIPNELAQKFKPIERLHSFFTLIQSFVTSLMDLFRTGSPVVSPNADVQSPAASAAVSFETLMKAINSELTPAVYDMLPPMKQRQLNAIVEYLQSEKGSVGQDKIKLSSSIFKSIYNVTGFDDCDKHIPLLIFQIERFQQDLILLANGYSTVLEFLGISSTDQILVHLHRSTARDFRLQLERRTLTLESTNPTASARHHPSESTNDAVDSAQGSSIHPNTATSSSDTLQLSSMG